MALILFCLCLVEVTVLLNFTFINLGKKYFVSNHLRGGWKDLDQHSLARVENTTATRRGDKEMEAGIETSRKPPDEHIYIPPLQARRSRFGPEKTDVISACLLVKDDNHILSEWIAYHYTTLPLRHLVVAVDPISETSPADIIRRWNKDTSGKNAERDKYPEMDMDIHIWGDEEIYRGVNPEIAFKDAYYNETYTLEKELAKGPRGDKPEVVRLNNRLMYFFSRCMEFHKREQRSWVLLIDSDEFLTFNYMHSDDATMPPRPPLRPSKSQSLGELSWWRKRADYQAEAQKRLPQIENTTIAEFILTEADEHPWKYEDLPCYSFPRLTYGPYESEENHVRRGVPDILNPYNFNTLRFRRHAQKSTNDKNRAGKVMIDVSRLSFQDLWKTSGSPHYLLQHECHTEYRFDTILRANHYLGSWDDYITRQDERRNLFEFKRRGIFKLVFEDDDVRPWIKLFYDRFGKKGMHLLQVGSDLKIPGNYSSFISEQLKEHFNHTSFISEQIRAKYLS